jgi:MFS family permease
MFALTSIPFGVGGAFVAVPLNVLLTKAGLSPDRVADVVWLTLLPPWLQVFYAPLVDLGPRRKVWLVILAILGGACLATAMILPLPSQLGLFTALAVFGQGLTGLTSACNGGLIANLMPADLRDKTSGWTNAANLGGNILGGGLVLTAARLYGNTTAAMVILLLTSAPSLFALTLPEPARAARRSAGEVFSTLFRDLWHTVKTKHGATGMLFCISPVGTAVLLNLYSSLAPDYNAAPWVPELVNGYWGGLVTAGSALATSYLLLNRMNRRHVYLLSGVLTAACCFLTMLAPVTQMTYIVGSLSYLLVTGVCYAAFNAVAYDIVGDAGSSAGTQYTLCTAAGNFAIFYVTKIDGFGYKLGHARGLLAADGLSNLAGVAALGLMLYLLGRNRGRTKATLAA